MALIKKTDSATFTGVTMGTVTSVQAAYAGIFATSYGAGSYSPARSIRGVDGGASVSYQTAGVPASLNSAASDLVVLSTDDANGTVSMTFPKLKPSGNSVNFAYQDYTEFKQDFVLAPGTGASIASMAPTIG